MTTPVFLTRVLLRNYKSIGACDVHLGPLTYLVGANGSGKSNFLDALHLVRDALSSSLDNALNEHGGLIPAHHRGRNRTRAIFAKPMAVATGLVCVVHEHAGDRATHRTETLYDLDL